MNHYKELTEIDEVLLQYVLYYCIYNVCVKHYSGETTH